MANAPVSIAVEGLVDEAVLRRVLQCAGLDCTRSYGFRGKDHLLSRLNDYARAACYEPWVVLVDLDREQVCVPQYILDLVPEPRPPHLYLRVAVRAVESWLLADRQRVATFLGVPVARVPACPDTEVNPKTTLVDLARRSRRTRIRRDIVPRDNSGASVGPLYASRLIEFVVGIQEPWRPDVAAQSSPSLQRCLDRLRTASLA